MPKDSTSKKTSGNLKLILIGAILVVAILAVVFFVLPALTGSGNGFPSAQQISSIFGSTFTASGIVTANSTMVAQISSGYNNTVVSVSGENYTSATAKITIGELKFNAQGTSKLQSVLNNLNSNSTQKAALQAAGASIEQYNGVTYIISPQGTVEGFDGSTFFEILIQGLAPSQSQLNSLAQAVISSI